jgi:hypothetical protein
MQTISVLVSIVKYHFVFSLSSTVTGALFSG